MAISINSLVRRVISNPTAEDRYEKDDCNDAKIVSWTVNAIATSLFEGASFDCGDPGVEKPPANLTYQLRAEQVPRWLRFESLQTGYRYGGTYKQCLLSLFVLHNECLNAWTMIAASVFSTCAFVYAIVGLRVTGLHVLPFLFFYLSALLHLPFSVGYHLFLPISPSVYNKWRKLDVSFIFVGSVLLVCAFGWFVMPLWAVMTSTALAVMIAALGIYRLNTLEDGQALERSGHAVCIASIVLVYFFPLVYQAYKDVANLEITTAVGCATGVFLSLLLGGTVYANNFPERYYPETFDLVGSSHQLMHVGITIAHALEYIFLASAYQLYVDKDVSGSEPVVLAPSSSAYGMFA